MNIRVHYPSTDEGLKQLNERMAEVQASAIIKYIDNLNCTYEEKVQLLKNASEKTNE